MCSIDSNMQKLPSNISRSAVLCYVRWPGRAWWATASLAASSRAWQRSRSLPPLAGAGADTGLLSVGQSLRSAPCRVLSVACFGAWAPQPNHISFAVVYCAPTLRLYAVVKSCASASKACKLISFLEHESWTQRAFHASLGRFPPHQALEKVQAARSGTRPRQCLTWAQWAHVCVREQQQGAKEAQVVRR